MNIEVGDRNFPIWLLGDSNPKNWQDILVAPLDPRHPARHSIWTPVLDVIQDRVYRQSRRRVDTSTIYIRNAIEDPSNKPLGSVISWAPIVEQSIHEFRQILERYNPVFVFCFGAFSFEFIRRTLQQQPAHPFQYWGAKNLGNEYSQRLDNFNINAINAIPLLHTSISRGRFYESHNYFSQKEGGNYFEYAGNQIADKLLEHSQQLKIWIE